MRPEVQMAEAQALARQHGSTPEQQQQDSALRRSNGTATQQHTRATAHERTQIRTYELEPRNHTSKVTNFPTTTLPSSAGMKSRHSSSWPFNWETITATWRSWKASAIFLAKKMERSPLRSTL